MLKAVEGLVPEFLPFVQYTYCAPSSLFWVDRLLQSSEGVHQEDPIGSLLFCLIIYQLTLQMKSEFGVFYLDDGTRSQDVRLDLQMAEQALMSNIAIDSRRGVWDVQNVH